jgi:hypothetical protein
MHFQSLSVITFGGTIISDATDVDGNTGSTWNYGASNTNEFSGFNSSSDSPAKHGGEAEGMYGSWGVLDTAYSTMNTDKSMGTLNANIALCAGTAGAVCAG